MQLTRELCPEFVWKYSQPVSENTGLDGLCLQELMGPPALGIPWVPAINFQDYLVIHFELFHCRVYLYV